MGALAANGQFFTMTQTTIAAEVDEAFNVHRNFATQITFYGVVAVDDFTHFDHFRLSELMDAFFKRKTCFYADFFGFHLANAMNISKRNIKALSRRNIYTSNTSHKNLYI